MRQGRAATAGRRAPRRFRPSSSPLRQAVARPGRRRTVRHGRNLRQGRRGRCRQGRPYRSAVARARQLVAVLRSPAVCLRVLVAAPAQNAAHARMPAVHAVHSGEAAATTRPGGTRRQVSSCSSPVRPHTPAVEQHHQLRLRRCARRPRRAPARLLRRVTARRSGASRPRADRP